MVKGHSGCVGGEGGVCVGCVGRGCVWGRGDEAMHAESNEASHLTNTLVSSSNDRNWLVAKKIDSRCDLTCVYVHVSVCMCMVCM